LIVIILHTFFPFNFFWHFVFYFSLGKASKHLLPDSSETE